MERFFGDGDFPSNYVLTLPDSPKKKNIKMQFSGKINGFRVPSIFDKDFYFKNEVVSEAASFFSLKIQWGTHCIVCTLFRGQNEWNYCVKVTSSCGGIR